MQRMIMPEVKLEGDIFELLRSLGLPREDYAIFGSGPMIPRGLKPLDHDIDLVARGKAWQRATEHGEPVQQGDLQDHVVRLFDNRIEIFDGWKPGVWDVDNLIDDADVIDGLPFVQLGYVLEWKKEMGRVKDIHHIALIRDYLAMHEM